MLQLFRVFALLSTFSGCAEDHLLWTRFTENDFPARVNSIVTQLGNLLDSQNNLQYGQLTVAYDTEKPLASYQCPPDTYCKISISDLKCVHSIHGNTECEMRLYQNGICKLALTKRNESFQIRCPYDVTLEPKNGLIKSKSMTQ